jgi:Ca-activated chloride channel family protein
MGFLNPDVFWFLLGLLPLLVIWSFVGRWREKRLEKFMVRENWSDLASNFSRPARFHKGVLILLALVLSVVAAARPWYGTRERTVNQRGVNLILAVDISLSMNARDAGTIFRDGKQVVATRLDYAKQVARQIVVEKAQHRIGIMPFAGEAFLQCPLTSDRGVVLDVIEGLEFGLIDAPGSNFHDVVTKAGEAFDRSGDGRRILVILSDGEDHSGKLEQAIALAKEEEITVYALGIGSLAGAPVQRPDGSFATTPEGTKVVSRVSPEVLRDITERTGGAAYVATGSGQVDPSPLISELRGMEGEDIGEAKRVVREERYQWPLALALLCLMIEGLIRERRARKGIRA